MRQRVRHAGCLVHPEQSAQLRSALETELAKAFKASPRSDVVISYHSPFGSAGVNFRVQADARTIEADYEQWVAVRPPPLFGTEPDARVLDLAAQAADPPPFGCSTSAREPDATPWPWPAAATRSMRWR